MSSWGP